MLNQTVAALVLRALDLDVVRLALLSQLLRVGEHLGPGRRGVSAPGRSGTTAAGCCCWRAPRRAGLFHIAVASAGAIVPFTTDALSAPVHGSIQPALANSASQVTSRAMMSIDESCAASRRTSCRRWAVGCGGQHLVGDLVLAVALRVAVVDLGVGRAGYVGELVEVQRHRAGAGASATTAAAARGEQRRPEREAGEAGDPTTPPARSARRGTRPRAWPEVKRLLIIFPPAQARRRRTAAVPAAGPIGRALCMQ